LRSRGRYIVDLLFRILLGSGIILFILIFLSIIMTLMVKGGSHITLELVTQIPSDTFYNGGPGGILNAIAGSLLLAAGASVLASIWSVPIVLFLRLYLKTDSRTASLIRFVLDVLWGIPTIVYGAVSVIILFGVKASLLTGIIIVGIIEIPVLTRTLDEVARLLPVELIEASYALGATRSQTAFRVVLRELFPGFISAFLLAFGRGIGDAAAVLLVAGFSDSIPGSLFDQVATLPVSIFFQIQTPFPVVQERAYATGFILMLIILVVSLLSRYFYNRFSRFQINR